LQKNDHDLPYIVCPFQADLQYERQGGGHLPSAEIWPAKYRENDLRAGNGSSFSGQPWIAKSTS